MGTAPIAGNPGTLSRVGIVVPLPAPLVDRLSELRLRLGGDHSDVEPHLTLVTGLPVRDWSEALAHIRAVVGATPSFTVRLRGTATFQPISPVSYLRVEQGAGECERLHTSLQAGPLGFPSKFPFVPHVTLVQGLDDAGLQQARESQSGADWEVDVSRVMVSGDRGDEAWELVEKVELGPSV